MKKYKKNLDTGTIQNILHSVTGELIIVSPEYDLLWANKETAAGKKSEGGTKCYTCLYAQDAPCSGCPITESLRTGHPVSSKVILESPYRSLLVDASLLRDTPNILVHHHNITEVTRDESVLLAIFQNLPFGVILTDKDLDVQFASPGFFRIFPFIKNPVVGKDLRLIISRHLPPFPKNLLDFLFTLQNHRGTPSGKFELSYPLQRHMEILSLPLRHETALAFESGYLILFFDQTERATRQTLDKQREIQSEINLLFTTLYKKLSPSLEKIQTLSEELPKKELHRSKGGREIQQIQHESSHLLKQLEGLKRYSKKKTIDQEQVNLHALLRRIVGELTPLLNEKNIKVKYDLTPHLKPFTASRENIQQVLKAILLNAIEGIDPKVELPRKDFAPIIEIQTLMQRSDIELTIKDNGIGMDVEHLTKVFQLGYTTKDLSRHAGMGLFLCQMILRHLGGEIELSSTQGVGTKVVVKIPSIPFSYADVKEKATSEKKQPGQTRTTKLGIFKGKRVWILGEKNSTTDVIHKFLAKNGATAKIVRDAGFFHKRGIQDYSPSTFILNISDRKSALPFVSILKNRHQLGRTILIAPEELLPFFKSGLKDSGARFVKSPFPIESLMEALTALIL